MNILEQIKECESKAAAMRAEASAKARELVRDGDAATQEMCAKLVSDAKAAAEKQLEQAELAAEKKASDFITDSGKQDSAEISKAASGIDEAAAFIVRGVQKL